MQPTTNTKTPALVLCELKDPGVVGLESHSPFCLKVHRALKTAGLAYTSRRGRAPSDFKHLNPAGQVPILLVGDEPVFDSTRILARIEAMAPRSLLPADPRTSAEAWLWEDWADRSLSGFVVAARWADEANWPGVRDVYFSGAPWLVRALVAPRIRAGVVASLRARDVLRAGIEGAWDDYRRILDALEARAPEGGFWLSQGRPTVADIALFGHLHSLRTTLTPAQAREIALRPALTDWLDRVGEATSGRASRLPVQAKREAVVCD